MSDWELVSSEFEAVPKGDPIVSAQDVQLARQKLAKKYPQWFIKMLMPTAVRMTEHPYVSPQGSVPAFLRAAVREPLEFSENVASILHAPVDRESKFPFIGATKKDIEEHPLATKLGQLAGMAPEFAVGSTALRTAVPAWGALASRSAPSILRSMPVIGIESGLTSAAGAPPGKTLESGLSGGIGGALGYGVLGSLIKGLPGALRAGKQLFRGPEIKEALQNVKNHGRTIDDLLNSHKDEAIRAEEELRSYLNEGKAHDVRVARHVRDTERANRREISEGYRNLDKELEDKKIILTNPRSAKDILSELADVVKEGGFGTEKASKLAEELEKAKKPEDISAIDYLRATRTTRDLAYDALRKGYDPQLNAEQQFKFRQLGEDLKDKHAEMEDILEKGIGKQHYGTLKHLNNRWREEVAPLHTNRSFQRLKHKGQMSSNIINELRGDEPGNDILKQFIKSDEESVKNVLGQRYASNPMNLHAFDELSEEYRNMLPELEEKIASHREHLNKIDELKKIKESLAQEIKSAQEEFGEYKALVKKLRSRGTTAATLGAGALMYGGLKNRGEY